jgi:L,D-transpeptidase catalytic domain
LGRGWSIFAYKPLLCVAGRRYSRGAPAWASPYADFLIEIDKFAQRMTVTVNGQRLYEWPVSTGGSGYDTPSGTFKPFRMEIDHFSKEWDDAPHFLFSGARGINAAGTIPERGWSGD